MRRKLAVILGAAGALLLSAVTGAQAAVTHPAAPSAVSCFGSPSELINSLGYMSEQSNGNVDVKPNGATIFCVVGDAYPTEIAVWGSSNCLYANGPTSGGGALYIHVCNPGRDADLWEYYGSGALANVYIGLNGGTGQVASGYPLGNVVNMHIWNGTGPEEWRFGPL
jgi:hypothetical protein